MKTLLISHSDLNEIVVRVGVDRMMDELISRLKTALISFDETKTEIPVRAGFHYEVPVTGLIEWMPLLEKQRSVLMKIVGYHPDSPDTLKLPTILSTLSKYDPTSGHLVALADGTFLTAMRTGAASAVASLAMARPDSSTLGLVGCGAQAVTQLHALSRVFELNDVLIYDIDEAALKTFPARITACADDSLRIRHLPVEQVVAHADILCVATSVAIGKGPVFEAQQVRPWLHVNAVGSDFPGKLECPRDLLVESFVCPDVLEQATREGECQQLSVEEIADDLVTVVRDGDAYTHLRQQKTVFDSTGWALEDQIAMDLLLEYGRDFCMGTEIEIECLSADPRDPYEFLTQTTTAQASKKAI